MARVKIIKSEPPEELKDVVNNLCRTPTSRRYLNSLIELSLKEFQKHNPPILPLIRKGLLYIPELTVLTLQYQFMPFSDNLYVSAWLTGDIERFYIKRRRHFMRLGEDNIFSTRICYLNHNGESLSLS